MISHLDLYHRINYLCFIDHFILSALMALFGLILRSRTVEGACNQIIGSDLID